MDQATYNAHAAAIQSGRVVVHEGRSAASLKELNWIAGIVTKGGVTLDLVHDRPAAKPHTSLSNLRADDNIATAIVPDAITITKADYQAALDEHMRPLQIENEALQTVNGGLKARIATLETDAVAMIEANAILTRNVETLSGDKADLTKTIGELREHAGTLEADNASLASQVAQLLAQAATTEAPATETPAPAAKAK